MNKFDCNHYFHKDCLEDLFLEDDAGCPICNKLIWELIIG